MHSVEFYRTTRKQTKSSSKMLPPVGVEPRASDFNVLHATVWANSLFAGSFRTLGPYIIMLYWFLDLEIFEIDSTWQYTVQGSRALRLPANRELAQPVACRALKSDALGSTPTGSSILLDIFFVFSWVCRIYKIHLHLGKTQISSYVCWIMMHALKDFVVECFSSSVRLHLFESHYSGRFYKRL